MIIKDTLKQKQHVLLNNLSLIKLIITECLLSPNQLKISNYPNSRYRLSTKEL